MARIYFDSNVYSNLRRGQDSRYVALENAMEKYKSNLVFVFSHAHIRDKINDNSNLKFDDFEYMKKWVGDNYLSYHLLEKRTSFYLANPLDVFQDKDALDNINYIMDAVGPYKELRAFIEKELKDISYSVGGETYKIDELFKDGQIQGRFNEFIKASLYHQDKSRIPYYDHYTHSYVVLDNLGFSKDKLSKKNSFNNIFNDSLHSYYAQFCDFLVTEDTGLNQKSSILYKHFNASTQILTVDEFLAAVDSLGRNSEHGLLDFFSKLAYDLTSSPILYIDDEENPTVFRIVPQHKFFNFFDLLEVVNHFDKGFYIYLNKVPISHLSGAIFRERQLIIDKMLVLFGRDLYKGTAFDFEKEVEEMNRSVWKGRYWEIGDTQINAHTNSGSKEFCVQLGPFTRWIYMSRFINKKTQ